MPRPLAAKRYPALFDVYTQTSTQDPDTGGAVTVWNYTEPETYEGTVTSIRPSANLETFGTEYSDSEFLRVETAADPSNFELGQRVGNLRGSQDRYYRTRAGRPQVFDVDGINPEIDVNGRVVFVSLFCRLSSQQPQVIAAG